MNLWSHRYELCWCERWWDDSVVQMFFFVFQNACDLVRWEKAMQKRNDLWQERIFQHKW